MEELPKGTIGTKCQGCELGIIKALEDNLCFCPNCGQIFQQDL